MEKQKPTAKIYRFPQLQPVDEPYDDKPSGLGFADHEYVGSTPIVSLPANVIEIDFRPDAA